MKKNVIAEILTNMSPTLSVEQEAKLHSVLQKTFEQVLILPSESEKRQREQANEELLRAFISKEDRGVLGKDFALLSVYHRGLAIQREKTHRTAND